MKLVHFPVYFGPWCNCVMDFLLAFGVVLLGRLIKTTYSTSYYRNLIRRYS